MEYKPSTAPTYTALNEKIEMMSKWIYIILSKASPAGMMLPSLLLSTINYFVLDLGEESFLLPCPMM